MIGRFQELGSTADPHLTSIQHMIEGVVRATEILVERQASLWQRSLTAAEQQWQQSLTSSGQQFHEALNHSLEQSLNKHGEQLALIERQSAQYLADRWEKWQAALGQNTQALVAQQTELIKQGHAITSAVQAAGEVVELEKALNSNLNALAGAQHFEETLASLAAAVNLLSVRAGVAELPAKARGRAA
jgi:hypothetical protein